MMSEQKEEVETTEKGIGSTPHYAIQHPVNFNRQPEPHDWYRTFWDTKRIYKGSYRYKRGEKLRPEHYTKEAFNGWYYNDLDIAQFHEISTNGCPSTGNCVGCYTQGQLGRLCVNCCDSVSKYSIIWIQLEQ